MEKIKLESVFFGFKSTMLCYGYILLGRKEKKPLKYLIKDKRDALGTLIYNLYLF